MVIRVELFGRARLLAGRPQVELKVPEGATVRRAVQTLAETCPFLVGPVLLSHSSAPSAAYALCLNGRVFVDDLDTPLGPGDSLLLLPAAGGG